MQIEHIAGIGLASGGTLQQQGDLAVSRRLLAQVVIYDENISALIHKEFADSRAGIGRDIQHRCRL